jgi:hypothetical protein
MPSWAIYGNERRGGIHLPPDVVNLLTQPKAFDHADWTKYDSSIDDDSATDPDSTTLADSLIENTADAQHGILQAVAKDASSKTYNLSVYVKQPAVNERAGFVIGLDDGTDDGRFAFIDIDGESAGATGNYGSTFSGGTAVINTPAVNGWYLCEFNGVVTGTETTIRALFSLALTGGDNSYPGDGASHLYFYNAVLVEA